MPVCTAALFDVNRLTGLDLSASDLEELLPRLKCEVEGVEGGYVTYEATHDRPDLFSAEGLSRALKGLLGVEEGLRRFSVRRVGGALNEGPAYRPYVLFATVHGLRLDDEAIRQMMQLQEKLHATYGRGRRRVSIGVYDLSRIKLPVRYVEADPDAVRFVPLDSSEEMTLREIVRRHPKGREYGHLLEGKEKFPLLVDAEGEVLSLPPIVNSEGTRVTERTTDVLVDVTATDLRSAQEVLAVMVTSIAERGGEIGVVEVQSRDGVQALSLEPRVMTLDPSLVERIAGLSLEAREVAQHLRRMRFDAEVEGGVLRVLVPPYRIDVLHPIDLVEDVVIAYGIERLVPQFMPPQHSGAEDPLEVFSRRLRELVVGFGFQEVNNYLLTSEEVLYELMNAPAQPTVRVANPKPPQFTCLRTWITPQLLQVLARSKHADYPQRIFECGDVVLVDESSENMTREERRLALAVSDTRASLTDILAVVSELMRLMGLSYSLRRGEHPSFIRGRYAVVEVGGVSIGFVGEVHPAVLANWGLEKPVVAAELSVTAIYGLLSPRSLET